MPLLHTIVIGAVSRSMNTLAIPGETPGQKRSVNFPHSVVPPIEDKCLSIFFRDIGRQKAPR